MNGVIYVENSSNEKLAGKDRKVDTTYAAIDSTCSPTCPLKISNSCYAKLSFVGMVNKRLEKESNELSPLQIARAEAKAIDKSHKGKSIPNKTDCRIHVSGDSRTRKGTRLINQAVGRWLARCQDPSNSVWSYTHSWKHVPRKEWSNVSILASIESINQVEEVRKQGYAPAMVVDTHASDKAFKIDGCETTWIPCPAQTRDNVSCANCRLCMKADWLYASNRGITFAAHGINKNSLKRHLKVINK